MNESVNGDRYLAITDYRLLIVDYRLPISIRTFAFMIGTLQKQDIRKLSLDGIKTFFRAHGEKEYRALQVYEWIWMKSATDFDQMTNLSLSNRQLLKDHFSFQLLAIDKMQRSADGTIKNAVRLHDGLVVESVLIPHEKRITACISSQVGCSLDCKFCATARLKRMRNLSVDEIYDQVVAIREQSQLFFGRPLTNIVFMGMGEPLLNYSNVIGAIDKITSQKGLNMASKRITLSTVGIARMIRKMADDGVKFNLAVSLHAAIDKTRSAIMPINVTNTLDDLAGALQYWYHKTKRKVTYEYVVWQGINDTPEHASALLKFCKIIPCKVNLIEYNTIGDDNFRQAPESVLQSVMELLERNGVTTRVRRSRGKDIDAACGQLANKDE